MSTDVDFLSEFAFRVHEFHECFWAIGLGIRSLGVPLSTLTVNFPNPHPIKTIYLMVSLGLGWQGLIILMEVAAFTTDRTIQHSSTANILVRHGEFLLVDASGVN